MSDIAVRSSKDSIPSGAPDLSGVPMAAPPAIRLRITMLGRMDVRAVTGEPLLPRSRKTRGVLAVLALEYLGGQEVGASDEVGDEAIAGTAVDFQRIADLLWRRRGEEQARGSLRQALHELQEALGADGRGLIMATRETVALSDVAVWTDARALPALARDRVEALNLLQTEL